jgi:hypothetical protein
LRCRAADDTNLPQRSGGRGSLTRGIFAFYPKDMLSS